MADAIHLIANGPLAGHAPADPVMALDTTAGSIIHWCFNRLDRAGFGHTFTLLKCYVIAVALTYLPLLIAALLGPLSIAVPAEGHHLPFLYDLNVGFMFLVSLPCLIILTITDQQILVRALRSVQSDGTITIPHEDAKRLAARWHARFRMTNFAGQSLGVIAGITIAYFNLVTYTPAAVGFWIADEGHLLLAGYVFLYCIFLFYAVIPIYVLRNIAISLLLKDIVAHCELHLLPLHPDRCGGLRPVGRLGLRNQYALTLLGLNIVLLIVISRRYLDVPDSVNGLIVAAVAAYIFLGPVVFMAPLLPFRAGMLKTKSQLMSDVAQRLRVELDRLRAQLASGAISKEDDELIERLRKIGAVIDELPVWPFDAGTLRKFLIRRDDAPTRVLVGTLLSTAFVEDRTTKRPYTQVRPLAIMLAHLRRQADRRRAVRFIVLAAATTCVAFMFASGHARADGAWCALDALGCTNCGFHTHAQCLANVSGTGGSCARNPSHVASSDARGRKQRTN